MSKTLGYFLFALVYDICKLMPIKKKSVFCIMTHDDGEGSNVSIASKALMRADMGYTFSYLTKQDTDGVRTLSGRKSLLARIKSLFSFFLRKPYEMARAQIILMDNVFLPYAYLKGRKGTKVIQLWHGTGTIKKFGQDVNTGKLKELERLANANITHLIVNSPGMKVLYSKIFAVPQERVYPIGLPRTDELLRRIKRIELAGSNPDKDYIYDKYHLPAQKKLILYAPTFRDSMDQNPRIIELLKELGAQLPEEYHLGLRLHPFIANAYPQESLGENICQLSFEYDLNSLLLASDLLITDYSSIIFEYCLLKRPMIFYAYDYEEFSDHGRGFYYDYESFVPGPVAYSCQEVIELIKRKDFQQYKLDSFISSQYSYIDGNATARLIELIRQ